LDQNTQDVMTKKQIHLIILLLLAIYTRCYSQKITGYWESEDRTRIYKLSQQNDSTFQAILFHSTRPTDKKGAIVIKEIVQTKNSYKGIIYSLSDSLNIRVTIHSLLDGNKLKITIKRLVCIPVNLYWKKINP